jgi:GxxExxY protein
LAYDRYDDRPRGRHHHGGHGGHGGGHGGGHERRGIPLSDLDPALTDLSRRAIGCAIEVHKALGPGYDREVYLSALKLELSAEGVAFKEGHAFGVSYRNQKVGDAGADLYLGDRFLLNVLARSGEVTHGDRVGLRAALKAADLELGLVINFAERRLKDGLVRVLNIDKINAEREDEEGDDDEYEDEEGDD